jgi:hypothetical protein
MRIGITGHQQLDDPQGWSWVRAEIDKVLDQASRPLIGVTSLAVGADQVFAHAVLQKGGGLVVVVPFHGYEMQFDMLHERQEYLDLLAHASKKVVLSKESTNERAYFEAGIRVAEESDLLIAVWNGKPAEGLGGTGDIVDYAKRRGKRIIHINPVSFTINHLNANKKHYGL